VDIELRQLPGGKSSSWRSFAVEGDPGSIERWYRSAWLPYYSKVLPRKTRKATVVASYPEFIQGALASKERSRYGEQQMPRHVLDVITSEIGCSTTDNAASSLRRRILIPP
jgi:hypothetical protein